MKYINYFKKTFFILLVFTLLFTFTSPTFATQTISIVLDGTPIKTTTNPIISNGTTLVPLRTISENLGATVNFDKASSTISIVKGNSHILLTIDQKSVQVNGITKQLLTAPTIINGTTLVPLRFVSETLNCNAKWNAKTQTITLTSLQNPIATLIIKNFGTIEVELYPEFAPNTVNNFISLANSGFYNGLIFHRVINDFMIQGGDPLGTGLGGPNYSIYGEFSTNGFSQNTLSHTKGVISMARSYLPNSAGSQFFIVTSDNATHLDDQYAAFGKVISGLDVALAIQLIDTDNNNKPLSDVIINSVNIDLNGYNFSNPTVIFE